MYKTICATLIFAAFSFAQSAFAQEKTTADSSFKPSGKIWGCVFGDYYYKAHADSFSRGGANQYTGIEQGRNAFQIRRVYLGYNYDISPKFSAEALLAAEDNMTSSGGAATGDLLTNNKLGVYIKLANLRWKNIWKGTDFIIGQVATPAFSLVTEPVWSYRAVERAVADMRRTSSYDLGVSLQGKFDSKATFGYNIMVGNGTGAKPENNSFKWFYGDVYAKLLDKRLIIDLYADYQRLHKTPSWHHSRNMVKGFAAYTVPTFTVGLEAFINHGQEDVIGTNSLGKDTISANAVAVSAFVRGRLMKDKLNFFARVDSYNPDINYNNDLYSSYEGFTAAFEPNNKELFFTAGLDFTPVKNVHFIPNVWYNQYTSNQTGLTGRAKQDYDLVYRLTFYYIYK